MEKSRQPDRNDDYGCDSRCVYEYVDCVESEDGASICKTREQNFFTNIGDRYEIMKFSFDWADS